MKIMSGLVAVLLIYVGKETKMQLNSKNPKNKIGKTDLELNQISKILFSILFLISITLFFLSNRLFSSLWHIYIVRTFILLSAIIPISMKVNVDFAKLFYSLVINNDAFIPGTITRNSSIPEELRRIQYLLSDKTGTLTKNQMKFKSIKLYSNSIDTNN